jgi:hypothetical protein
MKLIKQLSIEQKMQVVILVIICFAALINYIRM